MSYLTCPGIESTDSGIFNHYGNVLVFPALNCGAVNACAVVGNSENGVVDSVLLGVDHYWHGTSSVRFPDRSNRTLALTVEIDPATRYTLKVNFDSIRFCTF